MNVKLQELVCQAVLTCLLCLAVPPSGLAQAGGVAQPEREEKPSGNQAAGKEEEVLTDPDAQDVAAPEGKFTDDEKNTLRSAAKGCVLDSEGTKKAAIQKFVSERVVSGLSPERKKKLYVAVHLLVWRQNTGGVNEQADGGCWYVVDVEENDIITGTRIFGTKNVVVLFGHFNYQLPIHPEDHAAVMAQERLDSNPRLNPDQREKEKATFKKRFDEEKAFHDERVSEAEKDLIAGIPVVYRAIAKKKLPINLQHLLALIRLGTIPKQEAELRAPPPANFFGSGPINNVPVPSNITIIPIGTEPKEHRIGTKLVLDNEGRYWWDVSVGVPVTKLTGLEFSEEDSQFNPKEVNKQTIYGMLNLFLWRVDLSNVSPWTPRLLFGTGITDRPGDRLLAGAGFGPKELQVFAGYAWARFQENAQTSGTTTQALSRRYRGEFAMGINVPVFSALKKLAGQ